MMPSQENLFSSPHVEELSKNSRKNLSVMVGPPSEIKR
jgi:hypothetical protein